MGTCRHCYKDFKTSSKLKKHVTQYHKKPLAQKLQNPYNTFNFILCICLSILPSPTAFRNHVIHQHLQLPFGKCLPCKKDIKTKKDWIQHQKEDMTGHHVLKETTIISSMIKPYNKNLKLTETQLLDKTLTNSDDLTQNIDHYLNIRRKIEKLHKTQQDHRVTAQINEHKMLTTDKLDHINNKMNTDPNKRLNVIDNTPIKTKDLLTLSGVCNNDMGHISGVIVDTFLSSLLEKFYEKDFANTRKLKILGSPFLEKLLNSETQNTNLSDFTINALIKWFKRKESRDAPPLLTWDLILAPVCRGEQWSLICIFPKSGKIRQYNSMPTPICIRKIIRFLTCLDKNLSKTRTITWQKDDDLQFTQQIAHKDSGPFICATAERLIFDASLTNMTQDMINTYRQKMTYQLIR